MFSQTFFDFFLLKKGGKFIDLCVKPFNLLARLAHRGPKARVKRLKGLIVEESIDSLNIKISSLINFKASKLCILRDIS